MNQSTSNQSNLIVHDEIGIISISNGKKNLIVYPEFVAIEVLKKFIDENDLKALIIIGEGRNFSYGADVELITSEKSNYDQLKEQLIKGKELLAYIEQLPIVTVAAINGGCFGAGLEIALSCQFRICSPKAFLGLPEVNRGLIPGLSGVERLTSIIGKAKTIEMCLLGKMLSAQEALEYGIVDKITKETNSLDEAERFVQDLIEDKSRTQILSIIDSSVNYENVVKDSSVFVELAKKHK